MPNHCDSSQRKREAKYLQELVPRFKVVTLDSPHFSVCAFTPCATPTRRVPRKRVKGSMALCKGICRTFTFRCSLLREHAGRPLRSVLRAHSFFLTLAPHSSQLTPSRKTMQAFGVPNIFDSFQRSHFGTASRFTGVSMCNVVLFGLLFRNFQSIQNDT